MKLTKRQERRANKIITLLDGLASRSGISLVKYAASKWLTVTRIRTRLAKRRAEIRRELRVVNRRLGY